MKKIKDNKKNFNRNLINKQKDPFSHVHVPVFDEVTITT